MNFEFIREETSIIKVIGVGGGGSNAVNHMYKQGIKGVEFIICNTDAQALMISPVPTKIQLGSSLTEGRGAGSIPEMGRNAAIENIDDIKKILSDNTKMVFITAGMGGGTGTGAAPVIAQAAKEMGILTVGIVTVPFEFEGKKRKIQADYGVEELKKNVDTLLIICNDKLREMYGNLKLGEAFSHADNILTTAAKGIAEIITVIGYINVDFEDVKTVMTNSGVAIMGSAIAAGEDRAIRAVEQALASPLIYDNNISGARYILMNISSGNSEVTMDEIGAITDYIQVEAGLTADIIWGNCHDESLNEQISVTIIATGFKTKNELGKEAERNNVKIHILKEDKLPEAGSYVPANEKNKNNSEPFLKSEAASESKAESNPSIFEFEISSRIEETELTAPLPVNTERSTEKKNSMTSQPIAEQQAEDPMLEQLRKSKERIAKLKSMNYRMGNQANQNELERIPAYVRRDIQLDSIPHSSEQHISRYTLNTEEEKKPEIKPNNSFLHDNVD